MTVADRTVKASNSSLTSQQDASPVRTVASGEGPALQATRPRNSNAAEGACGDSQAALTPAAGAIYLQAMVRSNSSSSLDQQASGREAGEASFAAAATGRKEADARQSSSSSSSRKASGRFYAPKIASVTASVIAPVTKLNSLSRGSSNLDGRQPPVVTTAAAGAVHEVRRAGLVASSSLAERAAAAIALLEAVGSASSMVSGLTDIAAPAGSAVSGTVALGVRSDTADAHSPPGNESKM